MNQHAQQQGKPRNIASGSVGVPSLDTDIRPPQVEERTAKNAPGNLASQHIDNNDSGPTLSKGMVTLYHDTVAPHLKPIFQYGFYFSSSYATLSRHHSKSYNPPGVAKLMVTFALRFPAERVRDLGLSYCAEPDTNQPANLPPELKERLQILNSFYESSDARAAETRKPRMLRDQVKGAHKLLIEEEKGSLFYYDLSIIDIDQTLKLNRRKAHFQKLKKYLSEISQNGGKPLAIEDCEEIEKTPARTQWIAPLYQLFSWVDYLLPKKSR
jgi:hypothetical protein